MSYSSRRGIYFIGIVLLISALGCGNLFKSTNKQSVVITGRVIDKSTNQPIDNAIVRIIRPLPEIDKVTDSAGAFTFGLSIDTSMTYSIEARKEGYSVYTTSILVIPGRDVTLPDLTLQSQQSDTTTGGNTNTGEASGYAASIELGSASSQSVVVKESGGNESAELMFQVRDSSGVPVDLNHSAQVQFQFGSAPGGGEALNPVQVMTDANGKASTTLTSGTKAGVVQVVAQATVNGKTIRSKPVPVSIHAGLPDQSHFTLVSDQYNIPFPKVGVKYPFTIYAGDKYGNVVTDGVSVYFTTNGGYIEGSANTGPDGSASVNLIDGNPFPQGGIGTITATTADENYNPVSTSIQVLFSKEPNITVSPTSFIIPNGGSQAFTYSVKDVNDYPMAPGSSISVNVEGANTTSQGDLNPLLRDVNPDFGNVSQLTDYSFIISDSQPDSVLAVPVRVTITSDGPNGYSKVVISGTSN